MTAPMNSQMITQKVRALISELFRIPIDSVTLQSSPQTIAKWESIAQLNLVLQIEQEFSIQLSPMMVSRIVDVASIVQIIEEKIAPRA